MKISSELIRKDGDFHLRLIIDGEVVSEKTVKPSYMTEYSSRAVFTVLEEA